MFGGLSVSPHGCCGRSTRGWHFFSDFADMKIKTCQGWKKAAFFLIQQARCLQVMANIAQVEPTWWSVTAQTLRLLEELEAGQETTDASYIYLYMRSTEGGSKERFGLRLHQRKAVMISSRVSQHSTRASGKTPRHLVSSDRSNQNVR